MEILKYNLPNNIEQTPFNWLKLMVGRFNCARYKVAVIVDTDFCKLDLYSQALLAAPYKINFYYGTMPDFSASFDILIVGSIDCIFINGLTNLFKPTLVCIPEQANIQANTQTLSFRPGFNIAFKQIRKTINMGLKNKTGVLSQTMPYQVQMWELEWEQINIQTQTWKNEFKTLENYYGECLDKCFL